jgi:subtilase family serine protease
MIIKSLRLSPRFRFHAGVGIAAALLMTAALLAQAPPSRSRLMAAISNARRLSMPGSLRPQARAQFDRGAMPAATRLQGISMVFNLSAEQQADLSALLAAQQNPASPLYHQWLTPAQYGARFGMSAADLAKVESWLQQQGFTIDAVAPSRIRFSGTVAQVESAFAAPMHYYQINGVRHFAPATALSLPAALAPTVAAIGNLDDFRPHARAVLSQRPRPNPHFTSGLTGNVFFSPADIATAYHINPQYAAGHDGAGQTIAVIGQSAVALSDIENFQNAAGLTVKDPSLVLVPNTGAATVFTSDEAESDLDLEWSGAIAPGAKIEFVYVGSSQNSGALDALTYAVEQDLAPIISSSYGDCEAIEGPAAMNAFDLTLQQAASQGQTVISSAGDLGSTDCSGIAGLTTTQQEALAVDYPASSAYVTGVGGTEITAANAAVGTYWQASSNGQDVHSSARSYIPEVAWNDDSANGINAGGGGASTFYSTKPSWQTGVPGIPADGKRDVPDLALYASPSLPGFLYCSSDTTVWNTNAGQAASCDSGFRDGATNDFTVAGGTSADAPVFAGMVAIINQAAGYTAGQGLINPTLYSLAANGATYASAFHDITGGNNDCTAGSSVCGSTAGFSAGTGYDQVTGLGSVDLANLVTAWPPNTGPTSSLIASTTAVAASSATPAVNATVSFTVTVSSDTGSSIPTGTVSLYLDNAAAVPVTLTSNGAAVYTTSFTASGPHQLLAIYAGDSTHASSNGVVTVNVPAGSIALSASALSVAAGGSGASTITVTPGGGYTGTVLLSFSTSNATALKNLCFGFTSMNSSGDGTVVIAGTAAASTQLTLDANAADCNAGALRSGTGKRALRALQPIHAAGFPGGRAGGLITALLAGMGLLLMGVLGGGFRRYRVWAGLIVLLAVGLTVAGCGGSSGGSGTVSNPPPGTYTITVTGQDANTQSISATTQFTFTIQ